MPITVEKLEERWTPTTVQATFAFSSRSSSLGSGSILVNLPLLNLGWAFVLSLTPQELTRPIGPCNWIPVAFSFCRGNSEVSWEKTTMHAQLSLTMEQHDRGDTSDECTLQNVGSHSTPLGTMEVVLADTCSAEVPLTTSCILSLHQLAKASLTVTISECPFANGLFHTSCRVNDAEAQAWLVKRSSDRPLSRALSTGQLSYVKFLTSSTRSTPGHTGKLLSTYASLSVLEEHVNLSSAKLGKEWTSALAVLNNVDNSDAKHIGEISCPDNYDYELDSDFEDDDEASPLATLGDQQLESSPKRSSSSFSSFGPDEASDQDSFDSQPAEIIKGPGESRHPSSAAAADEERAVLVKFAAHRTWYAFLWYCYTGRFEFSKLKSQAEPGVQRHRVTNFEDGPPPCSPKSMYRLADLVDSKTLKAKALQAIRERMTQGNVLDETFSKFTSKYPDVQEAQLGVLMGHCSSPEVKKAFLKTMSKFGSMPHAEPALSAFYDRLLQREITTKCDCNRQSVAKSRNQRGWYDEYMN